MALKSTVQGSRYTSCNSPPPAFSIFALFIICLLNFFFFSLLWFSISPLLSYLFCLSISPPSTFSNSFYFPVFISHISLPCLSFSFLSSLILSRFPKTSFAQSFHFLQPLTVFFFHFFHNFLS